MWELQVSIQDLPKYLHGLLVRDTSHEIVHVVHKFLDLHDDLMARFSLIPSNILHLFQLVKVETEFHCLENLSSWSLFLAIVQQVIDHVEGHRHDLLNKFLGD